MSEVKTRLADLIEPPRAGFWGANERSAIAPIPCRVVRNGDVAKNGYIARDGLPIRWFGAGELDKAEISEDDIVLVSSGAYTGNAGKVVGLPDGHRVIASNFVRRLRPKREFVPGWVFHLVRSDVVQVCVPAHTGGSAIPNLSGSLYGKCAVPPPPNRDEQQFVASVLNKIDEVIEHTEALIAKQQQVKAGLMHDLFTRGLTPDGQLRPTHSEAPDLYHETPLGWLPGCWDPKSMLQVATYQHGQPFPSAEYTEEGVLLLRPGNLHVSGIVRFDAMHTTRLPSVWLRRCPSLVLKRGDIVMNLTAQSLEDQFHGRVCIVAGDEPALLNQRIARFTPVGVRHRFLYWLLRSPQFRTQIDRTMQGTKVQHIYNSDLNRIRFWVPADPVEQEGIENCMQGVVDALELEESHLIKLRQLKKALMQALLTPPG